MGSFLDRPAPVAAGSPGEIRFIPARWLMIAFALAQAVLRRGALGKVGIATLLWSFAPRKLKLVAGALAAAAAVVVLGAVSAIALLLLQLS